MAHTSPIMIDLPDELVGDRVIVRPWTEADSDALWDAVDSSRDHLEPWMPWVDRYRNPDDALEYCRRCRARWFMRDDLAMAIIEKATGRIVGGTGFHRMNWTIRTFEIGYWVREDAQGRGFVTETVQMLTRLAFEELDACRVELRIQTDNVRSLKVPERLGFVLEGTLRQALLGSGDVPVDAHVFALLPDEYRALPWSTKNWE